MRREALAMPDTPKSTSQARCAYDHRVREQVVRTGTRCLPKHIRIPRSTVSTWRRRGQRPVVTIEPLDQDRQQLVDTIAKLDRRVRILTAVVRILLAMLRASGFTLAGERLPEGSAKAGILVSDARIPRARPARFLMRQRYSVADAVGTTAGCTSGTSNAESGAASSSGRSRARVADQCLG